MPGDPSYKLAYDQRIQAVKDSIKTEHNGSKGPMLDSDSAPGTEAKRNPGSSQLGVGSSK
jgi:hypothetical protein